MVYAVDLLTLKDGSLQSTPSPLTSRLLKIET